MNALNLSFYWKGPLNENNIKGPLNENNIKGPLNENNIKLGRLEFTMLVIVTN